MLTSVSTSLNRDLEALKRLVGWQHRLRETVHIAAGVPGALQVTGGSLEALQEAAPDRLSWQVFDHCAAVTRIYALFERAVSELVEEYLSLLPRVRPTYVDLDSAVRLNYRLGVGTILGKWSADGTSRYSHLAEDAIASGLADGLRNRPYSFVADAFLTDTDNYRADTLKRLFNRFGFADAFASVSKDPAVAAFCAAHLGSETAESYLNAFVRIRNEAAHGSINGTLSVNEICNYADFVALVVDAFATLLRSRTIRDGVPGGLSVRIGKVIHTFSDNIVGVEATSTESISVGDALFAGHRNIEPVNIVSLRIENEPREAIALAPGQQCGVKFDRRIPVSATIYRWTAQ